MKPHHPPIVAARTPLATTAAIAFLTRQTRYRSANTAQARVLYLLATGLVVVPLHRNDHGWVCAVLNANLQSPTCTPPSIPVTDVEVETALAVHLADPLASVNDTTYRTVWQARVHQTFSNPLIHHASRILADDLLLPRTRTVRLDPDTARRFLFGLHLRRELELRRLLADLTDAGLLVSDVADVGDDWDCHALVVPDAGAAPEQPHSGRVRAVARNPSRWRLR